MQKEKNILNEGKENEATHWESLLGDSTSLIVTLTDAIHKSSKLKTINPDFSAEILSWLIELDMDSTSKIAVSFTGSFPGANLAVLSALESLNIKATIISSCSSSSYGATDTAFIWLEMEKYLNEIGIFSNYSKLASIGGTADIGGNLDSMGVKICQDKISSIDGVEFLFDGDSLSNINRRISHYNNYSSSRENIPTVDLFINVGGGTFTVGPKPIRIMRSYGIIYPLQEEEILGDYIIDKMLKNEIPVINIHNVIELTDDYSIEKIVMKENEFSIDYSKDREDRTTYNPFSVFGALIITVCSTLFIGIKSYIEINERMRSSEPDSIL